MLGQAILLRWLLINQSIANHDMYFLLIALISNSFVETEKSYPRAFSSQYSIYCGFTRLLWQVDEILNISCPLRSRYQQAPPGLKRCIKLSMTDGIQRVFGMEYRPIQALEVCASAGLKVSLMPFHLLISNFQYIDRHYALQENFS